MSIEKFSKKTGEKSNPAQEISRRELLKMVVAGAGAAAVANQMKDRNQYDLVKTRAQLLKDGVEHKNLSRVETPHATYTIAYNNHTQLSSVEPLQGADVLILEDSGAYDSKEKALDMAMSASSSVDYRDLIKKAFSTEIPVFFVDLIEDGKEELTRNDREFYISKQKQKLIRTLEVAVGAGVAVSVVDDATAKPKEFNRRDFLKHGVKGLAAGYLLSHVPEKIAADTTNAEGKGKDESNIFRKVQKVTGTLNTAIHPETRNLQVDMRNTLIAQKSESVARLMQKELGRKPAIALEVGALHYEIEHELQRAEASRIDTLRSELGQQMSRQSLIARAQMHTLSEAELERYPLRATVSINGVVQPSQTLVVTFYNDRAMQEAE